MAIATPQAMNTDNDFLGSAYEIPASSSSGGKYLKFKNGTTHFRVLSQKALKGWEYWTADNKPKRLREKPTSVPTDIRINEDGKPERIRHFWAMAVWDYEASAVKILQITQSTIQKTIVALVQDRDFGHPTKYDLKVNRSGDGLETAYSVMPLHKPMPQEAIDALDQAPIYLDALWFGADPFSPESEKYAHFLFVIDATPLIALSQPVANPAGIRIRELKKLTGHTNEQLKEIAAKCNLPLSSASYTQAEADRFADHVLLDWATEGLGGGSTLFDDACAVLAKGGSDQDKLNQLVELVDGQRVGEDSENEDEETESEVQDSEPLAATSIEDLSANPF